MSVSHHHPCLPLTDVLWLSIKTIVGGCSWRCFYMNDFILVTNYLYTSLMSYYQTCRSCWPSKVHIEQSYLNCRFHYFVNQQCSGQIGDELDCGSLSDFLKKYIQFWGRLLFYISSAYIIAVIECVFVILDQSQWDFFDFNWALFSFSNVIMQCICFLCLDQQALSVKVIVSWSEYIDL